MAWVVLRVCGEKGALVGGGRGAKTKEDVDGGIGKPMPRKNKKRQATKRVGHKRTPWTIKPSSKK